MLDSHCVTQISFRLKVKVTALFLRLNNLLAFTLPITSHHTSAVIGNLFISCPHKISFKIRKILLFRLIVTGAKTSEDAWE